MKINTQLDAISFAKSLKARALIHFLMMCDKAYYTTSEPLIRDSIYDVIREIAIARQGESSDIVNYLKKIGYKPTRDFVSLPCRMSSLDKVKPGTGEVKAWKNGKIQVVITDKLDGISALLCYDGNNHWPDTFSRGTDDEGQNINRIRTHLNLPKVDSKMLIRGELIIKRALFEQKYSAIFKNPRNMVIGLVSRMYGDNSAIADLDFVAYSIINSDLTPEKQLIKLKRLGFKIPEYLVSDYINDSKLTEHLSFRKNKSEYEIDGLVLANNKVFADVKTGNPKNLISFKTNTADDEVEAVVKSVTWEVSKSGRVNPQVNIEPVDLKGVTISNLTGHNAYFIVNGHPFKDCKNFVGLKPKPIGKSAIIKITRSGDVIPKIVSVEVPASKPDMPAFDYEWNETGVYINVVKGANKREVAIKRLLHFFTTLKVDCVKEATIILFVDAGYTTPYKILSMTKEDLLSLPRFKETMAAKIYSSLQQALCNVAIETMADASGLFGIGMGERKAKLVFDAHPKILTYSTLEAYAAILEIKGFSTKTTERFAAGLPKFNVFCKRLNFKPKVHLKRLNIEVCFTGVRDSKLEALIKEKGGNVCKSVTKTTTHLVAKNTFDKSSKIEKAKEYNLPILSLDDCIRLIKSL